LSDRSLGTVRTRLEKMRASSERKVWDESTRQRILDYITAASYQLTLWDFSLFSFLDVAKGLAQTYRRARNAIPEDWDAVTAEDLHDLRRRVVVHRYQMEIVEPAWPRLGRIWVEEAQRLRNRLGKYQDLATLAGLTAPHQPLAPWRSRLTPAIERQQRDYAKSASRVAARLFAEPPKAFRRRIEALWIAQAEEDEAAAADKDAPAS
jgi:CHAD domain-containing protein